jgi:DNA (cytosine-5)-methyltransferase 1
MNELALFAGVGGGILGGKLLGWKTVCYVEREPFCIKVLKARIKDGHFDDAPIWDDVATFNGKPWRGLVDIVTAGFPCQPFSIAGKRLAEKDKRNMWPETIRIIKEVRPTWCLLENVPGLLSGSHNYFGQILRSLAECGYCARWECLSASAVGAHHHRNRLWIAAHSGSFFEVSPESSGCENGAKRSGGALQPSCRQNIRAGLPRANAWYASQPQLARVADGVADRMDRIKAIGNGQVPAVFRAAWTVLTQPVGSIKEEIVISDDKRSSIK